MFHAAKASRFWASGIAFLVWLGLFMIFGAAFFQTRKTELGAGSMNVAFIYAMASTITMMFV